jgi:hypothetical protein
MQAMDSRRRRFLLLTLAGGAAAAASAAVLAAPAARREPAEGRTAESRGYQLTAHVQRFYRSAGRL